MKFLWLKILFSPFKMPKPIFYFGKINKGTPYFLPRRKKKLTKKEAMNAAIKHKESYPETSRNKVISQIYKEKLRSYKFVDIKYLGINIVGLGWKYKWDSIRHEWNPMISIVFLGLQLHISFGLKDAMANMCYWEAWLTYRDIEKNNCKSISKEALIVETMMKDNAVWVSYENDRKIETNYWHDILKKKYKYLINGERVKITKKDELICSG